MIRLAITTPSCSDLSTGRVANLPAETEPLALAGKASDGVLDTKLLSLQLQGAGGLALDGCLGIVEVGR